MRTDSGVAAVLADVLGQAWDAGKQESGSREKAIEHLAARWMDLRTIDVADAPITAVVLNVADGTIASRFDEQYGVVFGDDRPFPWSRLRGPLVLLWHPDDRVLYQAGGS